MGDFIWMEKRIEQVQIRAWIIAAMTALLALSAPDGGIWTNFLLGTVLAVICMWVNKLCSCVVCGKWMWAVQLCWGSIMLLYFLSESSAVWGTEGDVVPVCLLLVALWSLWKGISSTAVVGATLIWFVVALLGGIMAAAAEDVKLNWAMKDAGEFTFSLIPLYLFPALVWQLPCEDQKKWEKWYIIIPVIGTLICGIVRGNVLEVPNGKTGILELSRSVELFGKVLRLEAATAMGVTLGLYCGVSLLLSVVSESIWKIAGQEKRVLLLQVGIAVIAGLLFNITISDAFAAIGSVICWVFLPAFAQAVGRRKKL